MKQPIPDKPKHLYGFLVEGFGLVFGKPMIDTLNQFVGIKEPRITQVVQDPITKKPNLLFVQAIGEPDEIYFNKIPLYYENRDKKILEKYTQVVSNIHLANVIPDGGKIQ